MNTQDDRTDVEALRAAWPKGRRIRLLECADPITRLRPGSLGRVTTIDFLGTVHVRWDNGSTLGLVPGVDRWEAVG